MSSPSKYTPELVERICEMVSIGETIRQIADDVGVSVGTVLNWVSMPEHVERYARARDTASDIFEAEIIEAALASSPETASADKVKIDALKWVAARRSPKKYGDRVQAEVTGRDGSPLLTGISIELVRPNGKD